jgi:hypothetical protein
MVSRLSMRRLVAVECQPVVPVLPDRMHSIGPALAIPKGFHAIPSVRILDEKLADSQLSRRAQLAEFLSPPVALSAYRCLALMLITASHYFALQNCDSENHAI